SDSVIFHYFTLRVCLCVCLHATLCVCVCVCVYVCVCVCVRAILCVCALCVCVSLHVCSTPVLCVWRALPPAELAHPEGNAPGLLQVHSGHLPLWSHGGRLPPLRPAR